MGDEEDHAVSITCIRGENLRDTDWFGNSDPYLVIYHKESKSELFRTAIKHGGGPNPYWHEKAQILGVLEGDELEFKVFDDDTHQKDELMAVSTYVLGNQFSGPLPCQISKGLIHLEISTVFKASEMDLGDDYREVQAETHEPAGGHMQRVTTNTSSNQDAWGVTMTIIKGKDLKAGDYFGDSDPYVLVRHKDSGTEMYRTKVGTDSKHPVWNEKATVFGIQPGHVVTVEVHDHDKNGTDDFIGSFDYTLGEASDGDGWRAISDGKAGHDGQVQIHFSQVAKKDGLYAADKRNSRASYSSRKSIKDAYNQGGAGYRGASNYQAPLGAVPEGDQEYGAIPPAGVGGYGLQRKCSMAMPEGVSTYQPRSNRYGNGIHYWIEDEAYPSASSAKELWEKKVECQPDQSAYWNTLGGYGGGSVNGQDYTEIECYEKALELDDGNKMAWTNLGGAGGSDTYSQQFCYEKALLYNVSHISFLNLGAAGGGSFQGKHMSPVECFENALYIKDDYVLAWVNLAAHDGGNVKGRQYNSKEAYIKALELDDKNSRAWCNLGAFDGAEVNGEQVSAAECYEKALAINPEYANAWHNLGILGGDRNARECFEKAVEIKPDESEYWNSLGTVGGGTVDGQDYTPTGCYEKCIDLGPHDGKVWYNLAGLGGSERYDEGHCIEQALGLSPNTLYGAWNLAGLKGGTTVDGNRYEPKECFEAAIERKPEEPEAWANLGTVGGGSYQNHWYNESECFSKALDLDPSLESVWFNLAVSGGLGDNDVKHCWCKVLSSDDTNADAWYGLAQVDGGDVDGHGYMNKETCLENAIQNNSEMSEAYAELGMLRGKYGEHTGGYAGGGYGRTSQKDGGQYGRTSRKEGGQYGRTSHQEGPGDQEGPGEGY